MPPAKPRLRAEYSRRGPRVKAHSTDGPVPLAPRAQIALHSALALEVTSGSVPEP
jgi:hypothetical protein